MSVDAPIPPPFRLERQIPIAMIAGLVLQTGLGLLWAGGAAERIAALERRMERQSGVAERLARLEVQAVASQASLTRIEAKLDAEGARR